MVPSYTATHANAAFDFTAWMQMQLTDVEKALDAFLLASAHRADEQDAPASLIDPMRYAVLDGGKRLRPLLVLAAHDAVASSGTPCAAAAMRAACAVELIHAYSLVHDDMPCMDNDVLRRGKPTVHVQYGEASALLAGDALQALAFELLTPQDTSVPAIVQAQLCALLARAAGCAGMAGGQAIDLASVGVKLSQSTLRHMHQLKTGALLKGSVLMGAASAQADDTVLQALAVYGEALGLAFQVVDDILDATADSATLGKTAGKDALQEKPTYVSIMGLEASQAYAAGLLQQALNALDGLALPHDDGLRALAHMVVHRAS
ncbi:polyprenyl synthetase family protein [Curvibacter sp. CHRR-16]|uniref:polyprenyl synthetase family protein n=1 Tax=Curvibacter sp. CHRR-16 TaxID=2835872 RepID=UPI001BD91DF2|nr:farnesyl diphosphate synthase [Curvibacter sp. CHRR-16]MBT0570789.1 polyprenyl synthetase family protein [Curvibacter sp. CHRR-16]